MVMGECGGGDPDLALTVRRDKRLLVKDLQLGGTCSIGPNDAVVIEALKLSELELVAMLDDRKIPARLRRHSYSGRFILRRNAL